MPIVEKIKTGIASFLALAYFFGFLIWNIYLGRFGFFESELLQTRFLSAGTLFILFAAACAFVTTLLWKFTARWLPKFAQRLRQILTNKIKWLFILMPFLAILLLVVFATSIFPRIDQAFGGARPVAISAIGTTTQIDYLAKFGVKPVDENKVQTQPLCKLYQNDRFVILGVANREGEKLWVRGGAITLRNDQVLGFHSFYSLAGSGVKDVENLICKFPLSIYSMSDMPPLFK